MINEIIVTENDVGSLRHGPGNELKEMLSSYQYGGCNCNAHAIQMNVWGPDGCQQNIETIVGWLEEGAKERGLRFPFRKSLARMLVKRAIRKSRKNLHTAEPSMKDVPCYVINLKRRPEKLKAFQNRVAAIADWPFATPERWNAVDGKDVITPPWFKQGRAAWGCYRSHLGLLEHCLNNSVDAYVVFEDDATFVDDFSARFNSYYSALPSEGLVYIGGQHRFKKKFPPKPVNEHVLRPHDVNRTHAFMITGRKMMLTIYDWLHRWHQWGDRHHVDHRLGALAQLGNHPVYAPTEWLCGQAAGHSDINGKYHEERFLVR